MTLSRTDAAHALGEVEAAQARAHVFARYARQGPVLIAWGLVWLACNLVGQFAPAQAGWAWLGGDALGVAASVWFNRRGDGRGRGARSALTFLIIAALLFGVFLVSPPRSGAAVGAVISLCVAGAYALVGLWTGGTRWTFLGAALFGVVLLGWFAAPAWFPLWMAVAGGGALILGGLWLRKA